MMLAIDPATFAKGAFWDRSLADRPHDQIVAGLAPDPPGDHPGGPGPPEPGGVPVAVVGRTLPDRFDLDLFLGTQARSVRFPARVSSGSRPSGMQAGRWWWSTSVPWPGSPRPRACCGPREPRAGTGRALVGRHPGRRRGHRRPRRARREQLLAISWTFEFLQALGVLTGLICAGGLLLYLETRQRSRRAAYALSRRMGLSRAAHLGSLLAEVGGTLLGNLRIGAALSFVAARLVYLRLDALPGAARYALAGPAAGPGRHGRGRARGHLAGRPGPPSGRPTGPTWRRCCALPGDVVCAGVVKECATATETVRATRGSTPPSRPSG